MPIFSKSLLGTFMPYEKQTYSYIFWLHKIFVWHI